MDGQETSRFGAQLLDGDRATIRSGDTVILGTRTPKLDGLHIEPGATLLLAEDSATRPEIRSAWILVEGTLQAGTSPAQPFAHPQGALLKLTDFQDPASQDPDSSEWLIPQVSPEAEAMLRDRGLVVYNDGRLLLYGEDTGASWTRPRAALDGSADLIPGATSLQVEDPAAVALWRPGDSVVLTSTDYDDAQAERLSLLSVDPVGGVLGFERVSNAGGQSGLGLEFLHISRRFETDAPAVPGTGDASWAFEERPELLHLTRSIVLHGQLQAADHQHAPDSVFLAHRGHVAVLTDDPVDLVPQVELYRVEFRRLGVEGRLGRYALHFHQLGETRDAQGQPRIRVEGCSFHNVLNHFLSIHGTQGVLFRGNVGYIARGHGFFLEDVTATGNTLEDNVGCGVQPPDPSVYPAADTDPYHDEAVAADNRTPAVFWMVHPDNRIAGNVAAGSTHHGFWFQNAGTPIVFPGHDGSGASAFQDNEAHSVAGAGFYQESEDGFRYTMGVQQDAGGQDIPTWQDLRAWRCRSYGFWYRAYGESLLRGLRAADCRGGLYPASEGIQTPGMARIRVEDGLLVGETPNPGTPGLPHEVAAGRSLPQTEAFCPDCLPAGSDPHALAWDALCGVELYDGLLELSGVRFAGFEDRDLDWDSDGDGTPDTTTTRPAGALSQVGYDSDFAADPRNAVEGLRFTQGSGTVWDVQRTVWFRAGTANMPRNTVFVDRDNSLGLDPDPQATGPVYVMPDEEIHTWGLAGNVEADRGVRWIADTDPATVPDYALLELELPVPQATPLPGQIRVVAGIGLSQTPTQTVTRTPFDPALGRPYTFPFAVQLGDPGAAPEYTLKYLGLGTDPPPSQVTVKLKFAQNLDRAVLLALPLPRKPDIGLGDVVQWNAADITDNEYGSTLDDLRVDGTTTTWWLWDGSSGPGLIYLRPVLISGDLASGTLDSLTITLN